MSIARRTRTTARRGRAVAAAGAAAAVVFSACSPGGSDEPTLEQRVQCHAPTSLQVQVTGGAQEDSLTIAAGGIGASPLRSTSPDEPPQAPEPEVPVQDLPSGLHARVADLSSGQIVRSETLAGGVARTEPLEEGDYLVGLIDVAETGRIDGLATSEVTVDERGSTVSSPSVGQPRDLPVEALVVEDGAVEARVAVEDASSAQIQGWLEAPGGSGESAAPEDEEGPDGSETAEAAESSGSDAVAADEEGRVRVDGLEGGEQSLVLVAESAQAPGIVEQAASCQVSAEDGALPPSDEASGS